MNLFASSRSAAVGLLGLAVFLAPFRVANAASEETFPVLQIGTHTYTNVTVTTKAKNYIFIFHQGGMLNIKLADLPPDVRESLGYPGDDKPKAVTNGPAAWAKAEVARLETPQLKGLRQNLARRIQPNKPIGPQLLALIGTGPVLTVLAVVGFAFLFHCYCFMLICRKAGRPGGPLVWLPVLQMFPLLRAAGMSRWWFVAWLLPLLNALAFMVWCVKIAKARGKSGWTAFFLILPLTSLLAVLYLAFSDGAAAAEEAAEPEVMSLQAV